MKKIDKTTQQVADDIIVSMTQAIQVLKMKLPKDDTHINQQTIVNMAITFFVGILATHLGIQKELDSSLSIMENLRKEKETKQ